MGSIISCIYYIILLNSKLIAMKMFIKMHTYISRKVLWHFVEDNDQKWKINVLYRIKYILYCSTGVFIRSCCPRYTFICFPRLCPVTILLMPYMLSGDLFFTHLYEYTQLLNTLNDCLVIIIDLTRYQYDVFNSLLKVH